MERQCKVCGEYKELELFTKHRECVGGRSHTCLACKNFRQREQRSSTNNASTKKYEKTLNGYIMRTYRNMLSRVRGILKNKRHLYDGLEILDKEEFYSWSMASNFPVLMADYEKGGYDMKLAPSIDRIDSSLGYTVGNIRWITHSENSSLGSLSSHRKRKQTP